MAVAKILLLQSSFEKLDDLDEDDQRGVTRLMNEMATDARMELWWIQMRLSAKAKKQAAPTDDEIMFAMHRTQKAQQGEARCSGHSCGAFRAT